MQMNRVYKWMIFVVCCFPLWSLSQVNTVEFGKNRLQYKKFQWKFYQSPNFNVYITQNGTELGKYALQVAEEELRDLENFIEFSLQRRANLVIYNNYDDYKASNIGTGLDWQNSGGLTKLVNNKIPLYFDGNHNNLRIKIREGIAKVLTDNLLFGDDIGEFASNQALLDLPKWLVDGYVSYAAQPWSTEKDDALKSAILGGGYNNFYQFAFQQPMLAGHGFWHFMAEKYKKESVTYFLYLARIYKNLNQASLRICKKKFKDVLEEFMEYQLTKYANDIRQRRNAPKGQLAVTEEVDKKDFFRFQVNPNTRNNSYSVVEFKDGIYKVKLVENFYDERILFKSGALTRQGDMNPNSPVMAWDGKGTRLAVIYTEHGKTKMFVWDVIARYKRNKQTLDQFDQVIDASFMLDANTLVLSAVKNGHTDIFSYKIEEQKVEQITNDVYDDLDPTFVSFPNRSGIIFSSNRPSPDAPNKDTVLPSRYNYNVFMVDILNKSKEKQITQLTNVKLGNARFPMQYNTNHFTFVSDENGIGNRWAGFFSTQRDGLDTLYYVGDELLRNPTFQELDSALMAWQKQEPDSISYFQVFKDSTYTFPMTNYQSSLLETRIAGNNGQVSEVRREGDFKFLYKLKVDEAVLTKRNINARPTDYMKRLLSDNRAARGGPVTMKQQNANKANQSDTTKKVPKRVFQTEFEDDSTWTAPTVITQSIQKTMLERSKLFNYRLKFSADYILAGFTNNVLINRFQPYAGGFGPVQLNNGNAFNGTLRVGVTDIMEDYQFMGGVRLGTDLRDKDLFFSFYNRRKRLDWGVTYFRSNVTNLTGFFLGTPWELYNTQVNTNLYQLNLSYPISETKSVRANLGFRSDRGIIRPINFLTGGADRNGLAAPDSVATFGIARLEYVHDNTLNPTLNIWNGLRWKVYMDVNTPVGYTNSVRNTTFNFGFDGRYYKKIYRNFIWAGRAAADFSWGNAKVIYYLGGTDGWLAPRFNNANRPAPDQSYVFQSLSLNMRGYNQNVANGNNAVVINSEFRLPLFATLFNKPINNAFIRNFQLVQFIDLGTAWNGRFNGIQRPGEVISDPNSPLTIRVDAGGLGPLAGGYGFGARSTLLGHFLRFDAGWPMKGIFKGRPLLYVSLGFDF